MLYTKSPFTLATTKENCLPHDIAAAVRTKGHYLVFKLQFKVIISFILFSDTINVITDIGWIKNQYDKVQSCVDALCKEVSIRINAIWICSHFS